MARQRDVERAAEQYGYAAALLLAQVAAVEEADVPLRLEPDGTPPDWTQDQFDRVWACAWAWILLATAHRAWERVDPRP